jgi:prepilin signal peptidase PulO-like enzyme (type II secretory pathway)
MLLYFWLIPVLVWLFLLGITVGSFLNVCIVRLGHGKSLIWPGSHCGCCFRPVRLEHNIPLVSYWWLRGRCHTCGAPFAIRYFWIELGTGAALVVLFLLEVGCNIQALPSWGTWGFSFLEWGRFPPGAWGLLLWHFLLACTLIAMAGSWWEYGRVPHGITVTGIIAGLMGAGLFPWPWPGDPAREIYRFLPPFGIPPGFYPWPVWVPLPEWLPPGSCSLGLVTGLVGVLAVPGLWRLAAWLPTGGRQCLKASNPSTALLMVSGSFLGWQPALVALAITILVMPVVAGVCRALHRNRPGSAPFLWGAVLVVWLGWAWLGPLVSPFIFNPYLLSSLVVVCLLLAMVVEIMDNRRKKTATD